MKKVISFILCVVIILSSLSLVSFAYQQEDFNIENYTWDEIMAMNGYEFHQLLLH